MAEKMGYTVQLTHDEPDHRSSQTKEAFDEIILMSEPALAEAWLSPDDDVYNDL
jgi:hypothetical protein